MNDRIGMPQTYKFSEEIGVTEIRKDEKYWYYVVFEATYPTITHRTVYHSTNLLALSRHRDSLITKLDERKKIAYESSYSKGVEVIPTITERIIATNEQRIR